jgi:prepilin-type N-terminal cleavage/methylation domain-containing protein/prepilin-type processing-associated H-X9-DG protein
MKNGFTLIELLVVVAIIGILASVTVPAISNAHALSQSAVCKNQQRQLTIGASLYRTEHKVNPPTVISMNVHWDDHSILWQYLDNAEERMVCPEHFDSLYSTTGYNYNAMLGDELQLGSGITVQGIAPSDCPHPARCAIFGDGHDNKFMRATLSSASIRCGGRQAFRHNHATVVAWLDGHVSMQEKIWNNNCNDEEHVGFLSEDNNAYDPRILQLH